MKLFARDTSTQNTGTHRRQSKLFLRRDPNVIPVDVIRNDVVTDRTGIQLVPELGFQRFEKGLRSPAVPHKEILDTSSGAIFTKLLLLTKDLCSGVNSRICLILTEECGDTHCKMRFGRKTATYTQCIADLLLTIGNPLDRRQSNIIDLGVRAPQRTTGDRDLEISRQVIKIRIRRQLVCDLNCQRRTVNELMTINSRQWAARYVANYIPTCALGAQSHSGQRIDYLGQRIDRQPVKLYILARRNVCKISSIRICKIGYDAQLRAV